MNALFDRSNKNRASIETGRDSKIDFITILINWAKASTNQKYWILNFPLENSRTWIFTLSTLWNNTFQTQTSLLQLIFVYTYIYNKSNIVLIIIGHVDIVFLLPSFALLKKVGASSLMTTYCFVKKITKNAKNLLIFSSYTKQPRVKKSMRISLQSFLVIIPQMIEDMKCWICWVQCKIPDITST